VYNSTCAKMKWLCDNEGYGMLVRAWCPRTCRLCQPDADEDTDTSGGSDDIIALTSTRYETTSLELSVAKKSSQNITARLQRPGANDSSSNASSNGSSNVSLTNISEVPDVFQIQEAPTHWEITLPLLKTAHDAVVDVLAKASFVPRAFWSPGQEHFVFEVENSSLNSSDNVSTQAALKNGTTHAITLLEEPEEKCPVGYDKVGGHVYGGDQFGRGYDFVLPSMEECARWCSFTPGCGSFEYSRSQKRCFRNSQTRPTDFQDRRHYVFCRRTPCPTLLTEADCLGPKVAPGYLSTEVRMVPGSYCIWSAGKCQAPMACTYEDCFLPDGGLPGMDLPPSKTLWITRSGLMATMAKVGGLF
jgi:hypothetical protein